MKEPDGRDFWKDALARWNHLPSEEGVTTVVRGADRKRVALRRKGGVWHVVDPSDVGQRVTEVDLPTKALVPAFANAHTHLDLTHVGARDYDPADPRGFTAWIDMVRRVRALDPGKIRASVRLGIEKSLAGGVVAVGDIAGAMRTEPVDELRDSPMCGVSFVEFFGLGERQRAAADAMRSLVERYPIIADGVRLGLQPHALYSAGPEVFHAAGEAQRAHGVALCTHLAESIEERRIIVDGDGPMRDFLGTVGIEWSETRAKSPSECFATRAGGGRWLIAHANNLSDEDIELLGAMDIAVAFCARGHAYFGHERTLGAHRWRDLIDATIKVCLATDSMINLPGDSADRISPLDDARLLFRAHRTGDDAGDAALAKQLIEMITVAPGNALGLNPECFGLVPGPNLGVVAVEVGEIGGRSPCIAALESDAPPELIALSDKRAMERDGLLWARNDL